MAAAYDSYDYPTYWENRDYEHKSEVIALDRLLSRIKRIDKLIEIGAGYGRLASSYGYRAKSITLLDPSSKLLSIARKNHNSKKTKFVHSKIENLNKKFKSKTFDCVVMVRVLHHIEDLDSAFEGINRILNKRGYLILEFANKHHFKTTLKEFLKGNITFPMDIFSKDIRCQENLKKNTLPFINYHPDTVIKKLSEHGFDVEEKLSVSNIRSRISKKYLPLEFLTSLEYYLQKPFSYLYFGPSIFILARKRAV